MKVHTSKIDFFVEIHANVAYKLTGHFK